MAHASNTQSPTPRAPCWCWRFVTLYFIFEADGLSATRRRPPPTTLASFAESRALGHHRWNHGRTAPARTGSAAACAAGCWTCGSAEDQQEEGGQGYAGRRQDHPAEGRTDGGGAAGGREGTSERRHAIWSAMEESSRLLRSSSLP